MAKLIFGIYGGSGFGREVMPAARASVDMLGGAVGNLFFIDDSPSSEIINGQPVLTYDQFTHIDASERFICIAIAAGDTRAKLAEKLVRDGVKPWNVTAAEAIIMDDVSLGEGAILCPFVTLTSNMWIEDFAYIGTGAIIKQGSPQKPLVIGCGATVGMGAVVTKDVPSATTVVGNPAKVMAKD
jgi:acetyltransferase-like isoleucine patch superfamily enzyme